MTKLTQSISQHHRTLHCEQTILAAEARKHILCEKPMGMNVTECQQMVDACRENNVTLTIAYYRPFFPNIIKMKELMAGGSNRGGCARANQPHRFL